MNVLLIYPEMPDTFYAMKHFNKAIGRKAAYPPLGLLTIAPLLPHTWHKRLLDLNLKPLTNKELEWADYVLLSAMNVQEQSVRDIIANCNSMNVPVIAGGPLFTHEYSRFDGVAHFVLNEAEITLPLFLEDLENGQAKQIYQSDEYADISTSPLPDFSLADMDEYLYSIVQYSRGCPYMCDFCDVTALFGRKPRTKTSQQIINELEWLEKFSDVKLVLFADDNLIGNKRILKGDLLPALIKWRKAHNPSFFFATQLTINLADDEELMTLLIDAGFRHIFIGIETPDEDGLKQSRKNQNLKRNQLENITKLHQAGFIISAGFIVGFDTDTPSIFDQQVDFIQKSGIPLPIVNILKAPPGTELFDRMVKEERISKPFAFAEGDTNIYPIMDESVLYDGFISLTERIYEPQKSYERLIRFLETYKAPKTEVKVPESYNWSDLMIIIRVVFLLGIKSANRKYFWKLITWAFRNNKKHLDKAFFYGVMIHQMNQTNLFIKGQVNEQILALKNRSQKKNEIHKVSA